MLALPVTENRATTELKRTPDYRWRFQKCQLKFISSNSIKAPSQFKQYPLYKCVKMSKTITNKNGINLICDKINNKLDDTIKQDSDLFSNLIPWKPTNHAVSVSGGIMPGKCLLNGDTKCPSMNRHSLCTSSWTEIQLGMFTHLIYSTILCERSMRLKCEHVNYIFLRPESKNPAYYPQLHTTCTVFMATHYDS